MIAAPMFHSWGFAHFTLAMGLCSTIVLKRKFDPEATLSLTAQHQCTALVVVPVMLQRILDLDDEIDDAPLELAVTCRGVSGHARIVRASSLARAWSRLVAAVASCFESCGSV